MGSEKLSISETNNYVLKPGGGGKLGSGSSHVVRNLQSVSETKEREMCICRVIGIGSGTQEVSSVDYVSDYA